MRPKGWVFVPGSGGRPIPPTFQVDTERRIRRYAEEHFAGKYTRLDVRFRGKFCYIDAYTEPVVAPGWPPPDWHETREEHVERLRNTPIRLCRLRFYDRDRWGFAFFAYSSEKYELSIFPSGDWYGTPEEAFEAAAGAYLR